MPSANDPDSGPAIPAEQAALTHRQGLFRVRHLSATLALFPVWIGHSTDTEAAVALARTLSRTAMFRTCGVMPALSRPWPPPDSSEKNLWSLARDARGFLQSHPPQADYTLFAEYVLTEQLLLRELHLVVCDEHGDWVIVDRLVLNDRPEGLSQPQDRTEADSIVLAWLQYYLGNLTWQATCQEPSLPPALLVRASDRLHP